MLRGVPVPSVILRPGTENIRSHPDDGCALLDGLPVVPGHSHGKFRQIETETPLKLIAQMTKTYEIGTRSLSFPAPGRQAHKAAQNQSRPA